MEWGDCCPPGSRWLRGNNTPGALRQEKEDRRQSLAMNQAFMTGKLLPPLAEGLDPPFTPPHLFLTPHRKSTPSSSAFWRTFLWDANEDESNPRRQKRASLSKTNQIVQLFVATLSEAGIKLDIPLTSSSLLPLLRVRFPLLSKSVSGRDKRRQPGGQLRRDSVKRRGAPQGPDNHLQTLTGSHQLSVRAEDTVLAKKKKNNKCKSALNTAANDRQ